MRGRRSSWVSAACLGVIAVTVNWPAFPQGLGQDDTTDLIHYSYAALFGTGVYRLDDRTVTMLRIPVSYKIREPDGRRPGIRLRAPVTLGLHKFDFDSIFDIFDEDLSTISVVPGVALDFLIKPNWRVTPAAYLGVGRDLTNGISSGIFGGVISSNYAFEKFGYRFRLGNDLLVAGYRPEGGNSRSISRIGVGLDAEFPTKWQWAGGNVFINPQLIAYYYANEVEFVTLSQDREFIDAQVEIQFGLAIGRDPPMKILGFTVDRLGLGFRFSDDLDGIKLITRFPF